MYQRLAEHWPPRPKGVQKTDEAKEEAEKSEADLAKTDGYEVEGEDVEASDDSQAVSGEQTPPPTLNQWR